MNSRQWIKVNLFKHLSLECITNNDRKSQHTLFSQSSHKLIFTLRFPSNSSSERASIQSCANNISHLQLKHHINSMKRTDPEQQTTECNLSSMWAERKSVRARVCVCACVLVESAALTSASNLQLCLYAICSSKETSNFSEFLNF